MHFMLFFSFSLQEDCSRILVGLLVYNAYCMFNLELKLTIIADNVHAKC